ncbi:hypothetical protein HYE76_27630 [Pseudomonas tolaasii]|nr:hypothetical protein [Pseudomonas tolaasii]
MSRRCLVALTRKQIVATRYTPTLMGSMLIELYPYPAMMPVIVITIGLLWLVRPQWGGNGLRHAGISTAKLVVDECFKQPRRRLRLDRYKGDLGDRVKRALHGDALWDEVGAS